LQLDTPILFLTYKRFGTSELVFESIKRVKPKKLYFVSNAPKNNDLEEFEKILKVRSLINQIDWDCDVKTLFREEYLEVKQSITLSISWFFSLEEKGIILEDDCVPSLSFFTFCQELLNFYENNTEVYSIGGCCFFEDLNLPDNEYRFSKHAYIWGWATWRRAWLKYDLNMVEWPEFKNSNSFKSIFKNILVRYYWIRIFNLVYTSKINTWDYQWLYSIWLNDGITIIPNRNLISNVGFGLDSNFTHDNNSLEANMKVSEVRFPLNHFEGKIINKLEQEYVEKYIYRISIWSIIRNWAYEKYIDIKNKKNLMF
jgi:hypothetical protein